MKLMNINDKIQLGNEVILKPELLLVRDNDSNYNMTRDMTFKMFKDDVEGNQIVHEFLTPRFERVTEIALKQFKGDFRNNKTDTSNVTSTYTDGELNGDGNLVEKNLIVFLMSGGDVSKIDVTNYGYADYVDVQNYFEKDSKGDISFNSQLPATLIVVAKEVILSNLMLDGKTAKELGFQFD